MSTRSTRRPLVAGLAAVGVALSGLAVVSAADPARANPSGTGLVISEVYGAGGNTGAVYNADFVELYNPTDAAIQLTGRYIHYRAANGNQGGNPVALSGSVPAHGNFLIQMSGTGSNGGNLPTPDAVASPAFSMAAAGGQVFLLSGATNPFPNGANGNTAGDPAVVDMVGASDSLSFETAATTQAASAAQSLNRSATGADTDNNSVDFALAAPSPTNAGSGPEPEPCGDTIAEVQGTGNASPCAGQTATVQGVVTARYPSGNYNGMYIQTGGSGDTPDTTPNASDAIFVFGSNSMPAGVEIGDSVEVTGVVSEFSGLTEITAGAGGVTELANALEPVTPQGVVPGTDCALPGTDCLTGAALNAAREAHEGELFQPTGDYTVTDVHDGSAYNGSSFSSSFFGEIGLAAESDMPLVTPTEVIDAQATADIAARRAYNDAHRMILDDGASVTYWNTSNTGAMDQPFPWFTETNQVRVGAGVTFPKPVVMEWRNNTWKLQPQTRVTDAGSDWVAFEQTRPAEPEDVGGDLTLGTFNVLNYFTTLGADVPGCTSFKDREGNPIAVNSCPGSGPRGAWNQTSFERQQTKIVNAINTMDADIVVLEEIENSGIVDGTDRDEAVSALVDALNADAGSTRWAFVDSPTAIDPGEDVIRIAMIYNPDTVDLVGDSQLFYDAAFHNAREPFAQTFKARGEDDADGFAVIGNHFKSKGSGVDDGTGQGLANPDRIAQAQALAGFADDFAAEHGVEKVFLTGDFNANSMEDPVQVLTDAGYTSLESTDDPHEESYNFDGQIQSLDHVFANGAAMPDVTGVDIWTINSYESQYYEYSRYNYNVRELYSPAPFRASDHNPELVGIADDRVKPSMRAQHRPQKVRAGKTRAWLGVLVRAEGERPTGTIIVTLPDGETLQAGVWRGLAAVRLPTFDAPGTYALQIEYSGDDRVKPVSIQHTVKVVR